MALYRCSSGGGIKYAIPQSRITSNNSNSYINCFLEDIADSKLMTIDNISFYNSSKIRCSIYGVGGDNVGRDILNISSFPATIDLASCLASAISQGNASIRLSIEAKTTANWGGITITNLIVK